MTANYDHIAGFYDRLSRLVFGSSIVRAQVCLLPFIPACAQILIIGGGTGWILEEIAAVHPQGLNIDYIESSAKMIALSQQRKYQNNIVHFIHQPIEDHVFAKQYDVIITPFLFDNFSKDKIALLFEKLNTTLKPNGRWLFADFVIDAQSSLWQKLLLWVMYLFFRITSGIQTRELVPMDDFFRGYRDEFVAYHYSRFIRSTVYQKVTKV